MPRLPLLPVWEKGGGGKRGATPRLPLLPVWEKGGGGKRGQTHGIQKITHLS
jgi:hypothetical protein